jgi:hypothetical protein
MGYSSDISFISLKNCTRLAASLRSWTAAKLKSILKYRVPEQVGKVVVDLAVVKPALGQLRVSHYLQQCCVMISPSGVRSVAGAL